MAQLKTQSTHIILKLLIKSIEDYKKRKDCITLLSLMKEITAKNPVMWGDSIIGIDSYHYKY